MPALRSWIKHTQIIGPTLNIGTAAQGISLLKEVPGLLRAMAKHQRLSSRFLQRFHPTKVRDEILIGITMMLMVWVVAKAQTDSILAYNDFMQQLVSITSKPKQI